MLERTEKKLSSYYNNELQPGTEGRLYSIDRVTRIDRHLCETLAGVHDTLRPDLSIETGLAYGFSTLSFLDRMYANNYGHHIAIDPGQGQYNDVGRTAVEQHGFSDRFTWVNDRSDQAITKMVRENKRVQFVYFDGIHTFDGLLTDFVLSDQLLDINGLMVFNDMWMPSVRAIASFLTSNLQNYELIPKKHVHLCILRKSGADRRSWDHFVPFNSAGDVEKKKKGFLRKLLAG